MYYGIKQTNKQTLQNTSNNMMPGHRSFYLALSMSITYSGIPSKGCLPMSMSVSMCSLSSHSGCPSPPSPHRPTCSREHLNLQLLVPTALKFGGLSNLSPFQHILFISSFFYIFSLLAPFIHSSLENSFLINIHLFIHPAIHSSSLIISFSLLPILALLSQELFSPSLSSCSSTYH